MATPVSLDNPVIVDVTPTLGYMAIGAIMSTALWGISCMQTFLYYVHYPEDSLWMKITLAVLWGLDTTNIALIWSALWRPLFSNWGSVAVLTGTLPDMYHHNWVGAVLTGGVQGVFVYRVWVLYRSRFRWAILLATCILIFYQIAACVSYSVIGLGSPSLAIVSTHRMQVLAISNRACSIASDLLITGALLQTVFRNGIPKFTNGRQVVYRLVVVTINTGVWTSIFACLSIILLVSRPNGFEFALIDEPLRSLYLASLLSNLNARSFIRGRRFEFNEFHSGEELGPSVHSNFAAATPSKVTDTIVLSRGTDSLTAGTHHDYELDETGFSSRNKIGSV